VAAETAELVRMLLHTQTALNAVSRVQTQQTSVLTLLQVVG
jgi:hypothetical protein